MIPLSLHPDRLFSSDPAQRDFSRELYATIKELPIVSPHGHTDPQWYADNEAFSDASALFITACNLLAAINRACASISRGDAVVVATRA